MTQVLVDDGETVAATHVAADRFDFTNGYGSRDATVTPEKWTEFSLAWDDATSLPTVTLDGLTHKFTDAEEYRAWEWRSQKDHGMAFECWTCPNGTNLLVVSAARKIEPFTDQSKSGVAIIGLPTATFDNAPVRATYTNISGPQTDL
ncbi:MAG: hypothetical protein F4145_11995, partial [Boseongicola sp. SB0675_bin_26]|nr:hypothetical protein [Boseongicola sp. SB0675_bin_26]